MSSPHAADRRVAEGYWALVRGGMRWWGVALMVGLFAFMLPPWGGRSTSNVGFTLATVVGFALIWPLVRRGIVPLIVWVMAAATVLWGVVCVAAWVVNDSPTRWAWQAAARPLVLIGALALLVYLVQQPRRWPVAIIAVFVGGAISGSIDRLIPDTDHDVWRYALSPALTPLAIVLAAIAWHSRHRVWAVTVVAIVGVLDLVTGLRSGVLQVAVAVIAAVLYLVADRWVPRRALVLSAVGTVVLVALAIPVYGVAASTGVLGRNQQIKWERQSNAAGGILLGGRPEFRLALEVLPHVPVLGLGPDPVLPPEIVQVRDRLALEYTLNSVNDQNPTAAERGYFLVNTYNEIQSYWAAEGHGIYLHSGLFQYWLWCGPLVVIPFGVALAAGLLLVAWSARRFGAAGVLGSVVLLAKYLWDALFSPPSGTNVAVMALLVARVAAFEIERRRQSGENPAAEGGDPAGLIAPVTSGDGSDH